jgi:outer membrane protein assembly factor BamB
MQMTNMARLATILLILAAITSVGSLTIGAVVTHPLDPGSGNPPAAEADSCPSVTCIPFGLYGDITTPLLVGRLSDSSDSLTFVGTTKGMYVVAPGGKLQHFLYSPFGIKHVALIDDITGDGIREIVVALNDTQVPALRCYDGATWEKLWQFAPMAKIWDNVWLERQLIITNLEVIEDGGSQSIVVTSGRRVFSVNAKDGTGRRRFTAPSALWRMVTLTDLNGDHADEVFAGSDDGYLYLLSGKTGETRWRTKLAKRDGVDYQGISHLVSDIVVLDRESGLVVVASADGWAQMYDLGKRGRRWETTVLDKGTTGGYSSPEDLLLSLTPDVTDDGLPEVLLTKDPSGSYGYTEGEATLCDSTGNILWQKDAIACSAMGVETGSFEGQPVFLQRGNQEIKLVDLKDGQSVLHRTPLEALDSAGVIVKQPGGGYLSFSSTSDLAAISDKGELLWYYPRLTSVTAESGAFVGDETSDVLLCGEWGSSSQDGYTQVTTRSESGMEVGKGASSAEDPTVRLLKMMDGATRAMAWSYEVPYDAFKNNGGLKGIQVTPDLADGDNVQDAIGYSEDTVFVFNGKNGTLSTFQAGQPITSVDVIRNGASGNVIAVGIADGLMVFDSAGDQIWTTTSAEWAEDESGRFMVLDDINSDNVSDLAILSASKILVLQSTGTTSHYELHQTFDAETDSSIEYVEAVPDANGDGVGDLAYIQREQVRQQRGQVAPPRLPVLLERSLAGGEELFRVVLPGSSPAIDLACGDFDGDGHADLLAGSSDRGIVNLSVFSGKDGRTLGSYILSLGQQYRGLEGGWNRRKLPATSIGDLNGDGADDLVYSDGEVFADGRYTYTESWLHVSDVAHRKSLASIAASPSLRETGGGYHDGNSSMMLQAQIDTDGHLEVVGGVFEPSIPSCDPDANSEYFEGSSPQYLALVDIGSGRRLAGFAGFDPDTVSLFESHQPGILGVAGCGGVCFLRIRPDLQVTLPEDGAKTRPTLRVKWEGSTDGDFCQVYVDEVRKDMSNDSEARLYLAPGEHTVLVRSVDDCGRISYSPSDLRAPLTIKVAPSPWKPVWLVLSLFALLTVILLLSIPRLHRVLRARRRVTEQ